MDEKKVTMKVGNGAYGVRTIEASYPGNSHKIREKKEEQQKKVKKVVQGKVVTRKKTFFKRASDAIFGDDVDNVLAYIFHDVLIPAAKSTISDMVSGGIEMLLFGENHGSRTRRDGGKSYVSYNNYYKGEKRDERKPSQRNRSRHNFDDIILASRGEAEEVLSCLVDLVDDYGMASVADLYDMVGISTNYTDNRYGWTNLRSAAVSRVRDGYLIDLPRAVPLD